MTFATTFKEALSRSLVRLAPVCGLVLLLGAPRGNAQVTFTCPSLPSSTCNYLQTTIAGYYNSTFSNATANIYVTFGVTDLGQSQTPDNFMNYSDYVAALSAISSPSPVQVSALAALSKYDAGPYGSGMVEVRAALAAALGVTTSLPGITPALGGCTLGTSGCYNSVVTLTNSNPDITWYYIDQGGTEPAGAYDFYATVMHEADEVLGTSSCISTASMSPALRSGHTIDLRVIRPRGSRTKAHADPSLIDDCDSETQSGQIGTPSAVDLFRYQDKKKLILDSALSTTSGAYFSYDGGDTKGADGVDGNAKLYNTAANGEDYADFVSSTPDCGTSEAVQDAEGCPGEDAGLSILNDGGGEINILNAVGYNLVPATLTASPTFVDNDMTKIGKDEKTDLKLTNASSNKVAIGTISIVPIYGDSSQFTFDSSCDSLDAGKDCKVTVHFVANANDVGIITRAMLQVLNSGTTLQIPLTGTGK